MKIKIYNVSRRYPIKDKDDFFALRNVTLMFSDTGFVSIVGRSGSGKSTLLNLIAGIDKPSSGTILINDEDIYNYRKKQKSNYYKKEISILFQQYNLIEDETVLFNVMLPALISGYGVKKSKEKAKELLKFVNLSEHLYNKKASVVSGGEKQRVALARTLMNEPHILLCDEPTGALDSNNSIDVMNILKKYSENHLVIMVSHNLQLVNGYSDRVIQIASGMIKSDKTIKKNDKTLKHTKKRCRCGNIWINKLTRSSFKKHIKRNILTTVALSISLVFAFVAIGYINGKDASIEKAAVRQFDFGVGTISKEDKLTSGSLLSLTRTTRPNYEEISKNEFITNNFEIAHNFDVFLPQNSIVTYDQEVIENIQVLPIYNFDTTHIKLKELDQKMDGNLDSHSLIINDSCYELLKNVLKKEPLGEIINISNLIKTNYIDFDETIIYDDIDVSLNMTIFGVYKELKYLSTPKIYYSYTYIYRYFSEYLLENLSTYLDDEISVVRRLEECENFDLLTSYSYRLFPKNYQTFGYHNLNNQIASPYAFTSSSILVKDSLINFMDVAKYGIFLFLAITLIGTVLIVGIISFTSYSEDRKKSAILSCLGARSGEIMDIYLNESLLTGFMSLLISLGISYGLTFIINNIIYKRIDLENLISIPIKSFLGVPFLFPLIGLLLTILLSIICTCIPILFSKKISLKEELQSL